MTATTQSVGKQGEELACRLLTDLDYHILARNWRWQHLEVDIIAEDHGEYVFIEVKTRAEEGFYTAYSAVDDRKRRHIYQAAQAYMRHYAPDSPYRFDIITVVGAAPPYTVRHYRHAHFRPHG